MSRDERSPGRLIANPVVEKAIRKSLKKLTGELTEADYKNVYGLELDGKQLTDVKGLKKLAHNAHCCPIFAF